MRKKELRPEEALEECLEMLLQGASPQECLERFPQAGADLAPLLETARTLLFADAPSPGPQRREEILQAVFRRAWQEERRRRAPAPWWRSWALGLAASLLLLVGGLWAGMASTASLPGDALYPLKQAGEQARAWLARSPRAQAYLHLRLAEERAREMEALARQGRYEALEPTALRLAGHLERATAPFAPQGEPDALALLLQAPPSSLQPSDRGLQGSNGPTDAVLPPGSPPPEALTLPSEPAIPRLEGGNTGFAQDLRLRLAEGLARQGALLRLLAEQALPEAQPLVERAFQLALRAYDLALQRLEQAGPSP